MEHFSIHHGADERNVHPRVCCPININCSVADCGTKHYTNGNDSNNRSTHNCRSTAESADYQTQAGDLQGVAENNVFAFKDIPYASPPVGDLRWRKPQRASAWQVYAKADANGRFNRRFESTSEIV